MSRLVDDFFDETETHIPEDVSRLVEKQMDIADAIVAAIEKSHYKTRKEFAAAIGMKPSLLSRILAGNVNLTLKTITKIESALGMEIVSVKLPKSVQEKQFVVKPEAISEFLDYPFSELADQYTKRDIRVPSSEVSVGNKIVNNSIREMRIYGASA